MEVILDDVDFDLFKTYTNAGMSESLAIAVMIEQSKRDEKEREKNNT